MSNLTKRVLSAVAAVSLLFFVYKFFEVPGLIVISIAVNLLALREVEKLLSISANFTFRFLYYSLGLSIFLVNTLLENFGSLVFLVAFVLMHVVTLWERRSQTDLKSYESFSLKLTFSYVYASLLPAAGAKLLLFHKGVEWFLALLAIVFVGDIMAYFVGRSLGRRKLMVEVSPNKTIEGAIGGIVGSIAVGLVLNRVFFPNVSLGFFAALSLLVAMAAQSGDLFESLLKRVANVKDSGAIMPGHGGILDRLDGILFGAPVMLLGVYLIEKLY